MSSLKKTPIKSKSRKIVNNTTEENLGAKKDRAVEKKELIFIEYYDVLSCGFRPLTENGALSMAKELTDWVLNDDDALSITGFLKLKHITPKTFYTISDKFNVVKEAHAFALEIIGYRREMGAMKRKYDMGLVAQSMPIYSESWRSMLQWRNDLRIKAQEVINNNQRITVVMESFPSSPLVPEKAKQGDGDV